MSKTTILNGNLFANMVMGGSDCLNQNKKEVNDLNVFPVPDGDTGENMYLTISSFRADEAELDSNLGDVSKDISRAMLLGSRGNSGVILSQIFRGISEFLKDKEEATIEDVAKAYSEGVNKAYKAVPNPVEGTILTVFKDAVNYANSKIDKNSCLETYHLDLLEEMRKSLERTPELLSVLKDAGVVDSGGAGLVYIFEGMVKVLTEFNGKYLSNKCKNEIDLNLSCSKKCVSKKIHKKYGSVTVAMGDGVKETFKSMGIDYVVDGGQSMNPSTEDFIKAFDETAADTIFVYPNNKNIILTANQAASLYKESNVIVIPTKTIGQGYGALSILDFSSDNIEKIKSEAHEMMMHVKTGMISKANRDTISNNVNIKNGDYIGYEGDTIYVDSDDKNEAALKLFDSINSDDYCVVICLLGKDVSDDEGNDLYSKLSSKYSDKEFIVIRGNQPIYDYVLILE